MHQPGHIECLRRQNLHYRPVPRLSLCHNPPVLPSPNASSLHKSNPSAFLDHQTLVLSSAHARPAPNSQQDSPEIRSIRRRRRELKVSHRAESCVFLLLLQKKKRSAKQSIQVRRFLSRLLRGRDPPSLGGRGDYGEENAVRIMLISILCIRDGRAVMFRQKRKNALLFLVTCMRFLGWRWTSSPIAHRVANC